MVPSRVVYLENLVLMFELNIKFKNFSCYHGQHCIFIVVAMDNYCWGRDINKSYFSIHKPAHSFI